MIDLPAGLLIGTTAAGETVPPGNVITEVISGLLLILGSFLMLLAGIGMVRMPDLFTRMQAATKAATLGVGCVLLAMVVFWGDLAIAARTFLVIGFVFLTAPVAAHMIARAAYSTGVPLWENTVIDELHDAKKSWSLPPPPDEIPPHPDETEGQPTGT